MSRPLRRYDDCNKVTKELIDLDKNFDTIPRETSLSKRIKSVCFICTSTKKLRNCLTDIFLKDRAP